MAIKTQSAKAKGRLLQKYVASMLVSVANRAGIGLTDRDCRSTSMGKGGPDIEMSQQAFDLFGFDVECKNEKDPGNICLRYLKFRERHDAPLLGVFKRTVRGGRSSQPVFVIGEDFPLLSMEASDVADQAVDMPEGFDQITVVEVVSILYPQTPVRWKKGDNSLYLFSADGMVKELDRLVCVRLNSW